MKTRKQILCACLVLHFLLAGSGSAATYNVIDLRTLPGDDNSYASSINDNGQIVGSSYGSASDKSSACRFDPTGGGANIDLGGLGGYRNDAARSVNNSCQIVGGAHTGPGFSGRACLFDPTGGGANTNLGICPGYQQSGAESINDLGQIVGGCLNYGHDYASYSRACLFHPTGGSPTDLGALSSYARYSWAYSINDNNQIVGAAWHDLYVGYYDARACLFDPTGGGVNRDLGSLDGYNYSYAFSNNNSGQIVGWAYNAPDPSNRTPYHACLFDPTGGGANIDLGTLVGYDNNGATSINDHGQIVGNAWNSSGYYRACLFDPTGQGNNIDLNSLIDPSSGWTLTHAADINNNGWIVGYGINPSGQTHAFLLVPEPATIVLLVTGGLLMLLRWRKQSQTA